MDLGKQIGFYMTGRDEQSFIAALQAEADVVVVLNHFPKQEPQVLDSLPLTGSAVGDNTNLSIYNRAIVPKIVVYQVLARDEFALDITRSEVIQFSRCFIAPDGKLEPGRLWYDHKTMQGKPKRKAFLAWAQAVFHFIKENYYLNEVNRQYFGPEARVHFGLSQHTFAT